MSAINSFVIVFCVHGHPGHIDEGQRQFFNFAINMTPIIIHL